MKGTSATPYSVHPSPPPSHGRVNISAGDVPLISIPARIVLFSNVFLAVALVREKGDKQTEPNLIILKTGKVSKPHPLVRPGSLSESLMDAINFKFLALLVLNFAVGSNSYISSCTIFLAGKCASVNFKLKLESRRVCEPQFSRRISAVFEKENSAQTLIRPWEFPHQSL